MHRKFAVAFEGDPQNLYFFTAYAKFMSSFENVFEVANAEKKEVIIMGDFSPGARCQEETKKLKSTLQSMNMTQIVNEPTRVTRESQTLIDIFCTSQPQNDKMQKLQPLLCYTF